MRAPRSFGMRCQLQGSATSGGDSRQAQVVGQVRMVVRLRLGQPAVNCLGLSGLVELIGVKKRSAMTHAEPNADTPVSTHLSAKARHPKPAQGIAQHRPQKALRPPGIPARPAGQGHCWQRRHRSSLPLIFPPLAFESPAGWTGSSGPTRSVPATGCSRPKRVWGCNPVAGTLSEWPQRA